MTNGLSAPHGWFVSFSGCGCQRVTADQISVNGRASPLHVHVQNVVQGHDRASSKSNEICRLYPDQIVPADDSSYSKRGIERQPVVPPGQPQSGELAEGAPNTANTCTTSPDGCGITPAEIQSGRYTSRGTSCSASVSEPWWPISSLSLGVTRDCTMANSVRAATTRSPMRSRT